MPLAGSFRRAVVKLNERFSMLVPNIVSDQLYVYQCINGAAKYVEPNVPLVVWGSATNFQELTQQMQVHDDADDVGSVDKRDHSRVPRVFRTIRVNRYPATDQQLIGTISDYECRYVKNVDAA